jgi:hypothetical protein
MHVQLIGGIADHYGQLTGIVKCVREHVSGLAHLSKYRLEFFHAANEWFYEFQLTSARENGDSDRRGATACA